MTTVDDIGAAKWMTAETRLRAMRLVRTGKVYALGRVYEPEMPQLADNPRMKTGGYRYELKAWKRMPEEAPVPGVTHGSVSDGFAMHVHTGAHIDSLGHFFHGRTMFDGADVESGASPSGMTNLGIEKCPPIVARGVLLDVAGTQGTDLLQPGTPISDADLRAALERTGLALDPGDVALVRTGWGRNWAPGNREFMLTEPGLTRSAAEWLAAQRIVAIAMDNWGIDVHPAQRPELGSAVHEYSLAIAGTYLLENLDFEALSADGHSECLFIALPLPLKGASGSPLQPIALV